MDLSKSYDVFQPEKHDCRVHIIGCGSVGSTIAALIARSGVTKFTLWDFDYVEPHNMANQMFRQKDLGELKVEALKDIICEINPDIADHVKLKPKGWQGESLSGFVFLCVDSIETRKQIVEQHMNNLNVKAMFDFRTGLEDAQHYAADWQDYEMKQALLSTMNFTHEEAVAETPVSACNVSLSVAPTVWVVCALGVANFQNFWNGKPLKKVVLPNIYNFFLDAF